ncbi:DNA-dependent protein kinase catalytic subunit isoform X2 [Monomorium pharaonis]|uniref:DNA-dependent protein kinase catalytic subunit isoform X2 n=1 Tax=Monomorium pharaonis TaxID=307658 RepID=UPI00102E2119|nr:DNA-dependent protein kinase catalytic subunit isoform X2 [Monomorium pharaonis]
MDSYQTFIDIFKQAASHQYFKDLPNILKDGQQYLKLVSLEHFESVVCSIFDERDGLLWFLNHVIKKYQVIKRVVDNTLKEAFNFLEFFIIHFYITPCFVQYIQKIKYVCQIVLKKKNCNYYIKKAACNVFTKLIELFKDHDLKLVDTINEFKTDEQFALYRTEEKRFIFCIVSKIMKYNKNIYSQTFLNITLKRLNNSASNEYNDIIKQPKTHKNDFHLYFDALADMLDSVESPDTVRKMTVFHNSYEWIKYFSQTSSQQKKRTIMKSAIDLLCRHMDLFRDLLYPDYKYWHNFLQRLSSETTMYGNSGRSALKKFYQVIGQILTNQNSEENDYNDILVYFLQYFEKKFRDSNLDLITPRLIAYGFSQMAAPCKVHMSDFKIRSMYSITTSYALPLCSSEYSHSTHIESICCYQEALSEILCHMTDVTMEQVNILVKLSAYTIKRFPDLTKSNNALAVLTLIKTISNLATVNKSLLQRYLDSIVYDGVAWSCSHTLALDAELQQELNDLKQMPVCYKNYLPLWTGLLNAERYANEQLAQLVANTMMDVCITLINRLNINVKRTNEDTVLSDVAFTQSAVNQADFRVFANLVDLYVDMINATELSLFVNTVHRFLYEIVRLSYKYPLISGFYKLIRVGMKIFAHTLEEEEKGEEEEEEKSLESQQMEEILSNYLWHSLDLIPGFSNELLIACLYLILDAPFVHVKNLLPRTLPVFKMAFTIGLSNLDLAYTALTTLETWTTTMTTTTHKRNEQTNELVREIIVYLEPYLRSTESSVEISQDLTTTNKRVKRIDVIDTECTLQNFQRRVLLFLGSLDHDLLTSFVHERASRSTGASWNHKDLLKYKLPLPDARLNIHFDRMLPRIIALACDSSDRRTKIAACEVLHSITAYAIGFTARYLTDPENRDKPITLYSTLCKAVVTLGCDSDEVVCGLFHPLALQLMHWLSSRRMPMSPVIDLLFDGLTDDSNPALREFSGMCLAEFTRWSIRQNTFSEHIKEIIERINNLALHPLTRKRIAAAIAFNHLYMILREDDDTISIYWLEIFYSFVCSLDGCNDLSITNALSHIKRVMKVKANLLNTLNSSKRRKPHEFDNATLTYALYWLLSQCGTYDEHCRAKCMELYVNISQDIGSYAQETTQNFVQIYGINRLNDIILKGLESGIKDISLASNVTPLLKALDYYMWLINKKLLPIEMLFLDVDKQIIFFCIRSFACQFWQIITESSAETAATTIKSRELEQLQVLHCRVLMTTLNFIQVLLDVNIILPESLWDEPLSALTMKSIMNPRTVGFDVKNIQMTDKLPHVLETLLNSMRSKYSYALPDTFTKCLVNSVREHVIKLLNLCDIVENDSCDDLIQHVNGLSLLKRCDILDQTILETNGFANAEHMVDQIFRFLVSERIGELVCRDLSMRMIEYLRALMEFQFSLLSSTIIGNILSLTKKLEELIINDTPVTSVDCTIIKYGEHFLNTFESVIFKYMLTHERMITVVCNDMWRDNSSFLLKWIEDLLLFLRQHKRELQAHVNTTVDIILQQFTCLNNAVFNVDSRKERLLNIYSNAVHLKSKPTEATQNHEFYQWIRDQLMNNNDLEYKIKILKNFFVCLTDVTDPDLQMNLQILKINRRSLCSDLSETSVNAMKVIDCFETLLVLLSTTKSMIMLKCVIHFAAGAGNRLINEKLEEHLRQYYYGASLEHVLESLQLTYDAFMETNTTSETERLDILREFLLPAFKFCNAIAIERFFKKNILDLKKMMTKNIDCNDDAIKQIIVSKIGCFQLIAIMFARVDENKIDANGTIAQNELDQILIDRNHYRELFNNTLNTQSPLKITRIPGCQKLVRLLHCCAYNCLLAILSLKKEEYFYNFAFGNDNKRGLVILKNIVDCDTQYELDQTFKEYPKTREIIVNIRTTEVDRGGRQTHRYAYVHSYDLSACTLSEDINAYDLNKCVVLPANFHRSISTTNSDDSLRTHNATSIALNSNDFNEHECMPYICVLLRHIRKIFRLSDKEPEWLRLFLEIMQCDNQNIQLFMLKIISNTADEVFKPYARFALTQIIKTVTKYLQRHNLNYIITDILEILMDWYDVAVPSSEDGKAAAQRLFEVLINKVLMKSDNHRVDKYNLGLMKTMVEKWRNYLRVPSDFLNQKIISADTTVMYLILVLLDNDMAEEIIVRNDIVDFLLKPLSVWDTSNKDELPLQCCECLGLYLRSLDNGTHHETERENKKYEVKQKIFTILGFVKPGHTIKQIKRIAVLCRTYPEVALDYINVTISANDLARSYCLEIFMLAISRFSTEELVNNLRRMELQRILTNRESSCEKMALRIVRDIVTTVVPTDLLPYVNLVIPYVKDSITEYRELVYDILMKIYKRYSTDITADDDVIVQNLLSISVQNLLVGLLDPSHDLQDKILKFWTEETSLSTEKSKDRLIALLAMHSQVTTEVDAFATFVALMMLQLTTKSIDYTSKMFDAPLQDSCIFEKYKIPVSWRRRNLSCITPMFVDSLASQLSYSSFSQSVDYNDLYGTCLTPTFSYPRLLHGGLKLRATQDLQFEPTLDDDNAADVGTTFNILSYDIGFDRTTIQSTSRQSLQVAPRQKRFTRILANTSDVANIYRNEQIRKNEQRTERIKQENARQRSSVKLYRDYRIGDFPDIEISNASLIVPLQQLIKLDRLICKDVTVALFYSLIKETIEREKSDDFRLTIVENLKQILHKSCERDSSFNAVILETLLLLSRDAAIVADCDPRDLVKASKANHLNTLGALLVERSLLPHVQEDNLSPTTSKKMRMSDNYICNEETSKWSQLASLYKSLNDVDIVLSIFRGRQFFGQDVQEAALAEVDGDWIRAKNAFTNAYERTEDPLIKEHCLRGLLEAANNLCDWSAIDRLVKDRAGNGDLNNIWNDTWRDWIIPYACDAYLYASEEKNWDSNNDLEVIQSWIYDRDKLQTLMPVTGESLVIFLLKKDIKKATDLLNKLLDMTGKQWVELSPLCIELGICKLFKLQIMNDLDASLKILRCTKKTDYLNKTVSKALFNFWSMKTPTIRDNLIQWNKLAAYRAYSSMLFYDSCQKQKTKRRLFQINYQLRLDIVDAALNQKQRYIAERHLNCVRQTVCEEELLWLDARIKRLHADVETNMKKKMISYTDSWETLHKLLKSNKLDTISSTAIREHICTMASKIESLSRENIVFAKYLACNSTILRDIGITEPTSTHLSNIREYLLHYSLNNLRYCCSQDTTKLGEHYCTLAKYCYGRLNTEPENDEIFHDFLSSTLKSMFYDYLEAMHYFPCLLKPERFKDEQTRNTFVEECAKLRPWLFLRWRDLLFSFLETPFINRSTPSIAIAIIPIVHRLAETYPDAVVYTYYLTIERNPSILQNEEIQRIRKLLGDKAEEYERFLQAIQYVVQPKLYLKHYLDNAIKDLSQGKMTAIKSLLEKVYPNSSTHAAEEKNPQPGDIFGKEIASYEEKIRALAHEDLDAARKEILKLKETLNESLWKHMNKNVIYTNKLSKLKDYSPFLHKYVGSSSDGIEIPGQYTGEKEPEPRYHVRIVRFEPQVEVMQSLRKPIRISIVGDNGKEYKFLVKFGENLIVDRGLQQLYSTMNRTLRNDPDCRQRRLAIDTYEVIPLSSSFGLIQWIDDTKSLDDLIRFTLSNKEKECCKMIRDEYAGWINNAAPMKQRITDRYKEAVSRYSQQMVMENMKKLISKTRQTALRDAFETISSSPECFVTLRRNFVTSYATMCTAHWLAGIGDRHLQNTLVQVATGRCMGIDFGSAFGSGIRAPIPELVPFRLTPQILELLQPFTERDFLATIMTHAMRALRNDQGPILACMDIFVHKPIQRSFSINDDEIMKDDNDIDLIWSSKRNIEIVAKKLNGIHPSIITLEHLKEAHNDEYFARYCAIVTGKDELKQARSDPCIGNDHLTPAQQVDCLLDQAKDLNILGRMYANWQSWL